MTINEARETGSQSTEQKFKQSGVTVAVTSGLVSNLQMADSQIKAAGNTSSDRMKALVSGPSVRNSFFAEFQPCFSKISLSGLVFDGVVALVGAALCLLLMQFQALTQAPPLPDADRAV